MKVKELGHLTKETRLKESRKLLAGEGTKEEEPLSFEQRNASIREQKTTEGGGEG